MDTRRYHALDALRGVMMMLGIVLHGAQFYVADPPLPIPTDPAGTPAFGVIVLFIHAFRMPLFFVLAGFFASLLVEKYGVVGSWINRGKRVAVPLLVGCVTLVPLTAWIAVSFLVSVRTGQTGLVTSPGQLAALDLDALAEAGIRAEPSPAHLWFLYYLLWFYLTIPLCRTVSAWSRRGDRPRIIARIVGSPWLVPALALWTACTLAGFRAGVVFEGFVYFTPHLPSLLYYGSFFVLGYLFHGHRDVLGSFMAHAGRFAAIAAVGFPLSVWLSLRIVGGDTSPATAVAATLAHGLTTWSLIWAFTGAFLRWCDAPSPWVLYVSQSSYWVYLVHLPLVSAFALALLPTSLGAWSKFGIAVTGTTVIALVSYHWLARRSWISVMLNGRRFHTDWPWRTPQAELPTPWGQSTPGSPR